jgi:hypothetical protein
MEHLNYSIHNPPTREKFRLMSTVWFILQKPIASLWRGIEVARWDILCAKLFGFNATETDVDVEHYELMVHPTKYDGAGKIRRGTIYGLLDETKRLTPEPILSYRVTRIALSCMRYLYRKDHNNHLMHDNLIAAWATKSKQLPWLWRQRIRVTSIGRRQPTLDSDIPTYSFSQSLRRSHQRLYSEGIQSEKFYQERHIFYIWTLDLLYHTLRAATKSDELTKALSKPFIPSVACILFPSSHQTSPKSRRCLFRKGKSESLFRLRTPTDIYLYVDSSIRRVWTPQESSRSCVAKRNIAHNIMWFVTL